MATCISRTRRIKLAPKCNSTRSSTWTHTNLIKTHSKDWERKKVGRESNDRNTNLGERWQGHRHPAPPSAIAAARFALPSQEDDWPLPPASPLHDPLPGHAPRARLLLLLLLLPLSPISRSFRRQLSPSPSIMHVAGATFLKCSATVHLHNNTGTTATSPRVPTP